jgi:O-antigen ligase
MQFSQQLEEQLPRSLRAVFPRPFWVFAALLGLGLGAGFLSAIGDPTVMLRVALGLPLMLLLLRFRYGLLLAWSLFGMFIGSNVALFNGKNLDTALVIPTLLAAGMMPLRQTFQRLPALAVLCAYLIWVLLGMPSSPLATIDFLKAWALQLAGVGVAVVAINTLTSRKRLLGLVDATLVPGTAIALFGIYGYLTHRNGIVDPVTGDFRITSVFSDAPSLAIMLSLVLTLAIYRAFVSRGFLQRACAIFSALALAGAVVLTFTRGAMLSIPVSLLLLSIVVPTRRLRVMLLGGVTGAAAAIVVLATVVKVPPFARFFNGDVGSLNGRTYLWQALVQNVDPLRIFGHGLGAGDALLTQLEGAIGGQPGAVATSASNLFVGALYDSGVVGLALLAATYVTLGRSLLAGIRRTSGEQRLLFFVAAMALVNALLQALEASDLSGQGDGILFWTIMALPFAACWLEQPSLARDDHAPATFAGGPRLRPEDTLLARPGRPARDLR